MVGEREFSCSEFEVQPQPSWRPVSPCSSLAVQNSRSSRNMFEGAARGARSLAVQNSRSSRNARFARSLDRSSLAVQNSRSSRNARRLDPHPLQSLESVSKVMTIVPIVE